MSQVVTCDTQDRIGVITLNRPGDRNALNTEMREALLAAILSCDMDPAVRAIVVTGAGSDFCAGGDMNAMHQSLQNGDTTDLEHRITPVRNKIVLALHNSQKPVIAAINGATAGGGLGLALSCDIRLASTDAVFSLAFGRLGLHPEWGLSWTLPRIVGIERAKDMIWSAGRFSADEALELGLITRVVTQEALMSEVMKMATRFARGAPVAIRLSKKSLQESLNVSLEQSLDIETRAQAICSSTSDCREGVAAFMEKRHPVFQGK